MFNPVDLVIYFFVATAAVSLAMLLRSHPRYSKAKASGNKRSEYNNFRLIWSSCPILVYSLLMIILHFVAYLTETIIELTILLFIPVIFPLVPALVKYGRRAASN